MVNLRDEFLAAARKHNDTLQEAVVGYHYNDDQKWEERGKTFPVEPWNVAADKLNYRYDSDYGGADCHAVIAWGNLRVYFVHEYDGATCIASVPRHPQSCLPGYGGLE